MFKCYTKVRPERVVELLPLQPQALSAWLSEQPASITNWVQSTQFSAEPGSVLLIADEHGQLDKVLLGVSSLQTPWDIAAGVAKIPAATYQISAADMTDKTYHFAALGWALASYRFTKYKSLNQPQPVLLIDDHYRVERCESVVQAIYLIRDLINTPAEDMGPEELGQVAGNLGHSFGAQVTQIIDDDLLTRNYPAVYTVGRGSAKKSRLIDLTWGATNHPKLTLVGKGVCFDSGGLDLKPAQAMALMKKDMGGAAHVLGLANIIMQQRLPVRLRVLIPAVENSIGARAMRPGDVIKMRNGKHVEVGNTDAEGRLVLADALTEASAEKPDLIVDFATLTGAARVALGTDVPVFFSNNPELAQALLTSAENTVDPMWQLPLYQPYRQYLDSNIADLSNDPSSGYGGAISAALFLQEFIQSDKDWLHIDLMAWNLKSRPGRPEGGEAMAIRALFDYLQQRYA